MKNTKLKTFRELYANASTVRNTVMKLFLGKAFEGRNEYLLPRWLEEGLGNEAVLATAWCSYRHDGAFVAITGVRVQRGPLGDRYLVSGTEDMEYKCDKVEDVETCDDSAVADFIEEWLKSDVDGRMLSLARKLETMHDSDGETVRRMVTEHFPEFDTEDAETEPSVILEWARNYRP